MRDYGKISTTIWNSQKFEKVSDAAKLLYLYLHTCPHVTSSGCFVLKDGYALADLGWDQESYRKAMDSLCKAYLVAIDRGENVVRITQYLRFDPFTNPKHAQGAIKQVLLLPDCEQKLLCLKDIASSKHVKNNTEIQEAIDRLSKAYRNPEPEPEPEPDKEEGAKAPLSFRAENDESEDALDVPKDLDEIKLAFDSYNAAASQSDWPVAQVLSKARRSGIRARLKDAGGLGGWQAALAKARASPHCNGHNERGWTVDLDFLLQAKSFTRLMEGSYDERSRKTASGSQAGKRPDPAVEQALRLAGLEAPPGDTGY
jgi:hypothetical protein